MYVNARGSFLNNERVLGKVCLTCLVTILSAAAEMQVCQHGFEEYRPNFGSAHYLSSWLTVGIMADDIILTCDGGKHTAQKER